MTTTTKCHLGFLTLYGSQAYGLNTPESDIDIRGVMLSYQYTKNDFISPAEQITLDPNTSQLDGSIYRLEKFLKLAIKCNPGIVESLFVNPEDIIFVAKWFKPFLINRDKFLSKRIVNTFVGYANSQLNRIRTHKSWLLNPPKKQPVRADYGLNVYKTKDENKLSFVKSIIQKEIDSWEMDLSNIPDITRLELQNQVMQYCIPLVQASIDSDYHIGRRLAAAYQLGLTEDTIQLLRASLAYDKACQNWKSYQSWKLNRNPMRAALEQRYGYDTKHAMHLIRLLHMAKEVATTGNVIVKREADRELLMKIRYEGTLTYDQLTEYTQDQTDEIIRLVQLSSCPLPDQPKIEFINYLCRCAYQNATESYLSPTDLKAKVITATLQHLEK